MPRKKSTSIVLNEKVQEIKDRLAPAFGLKNILSVGLILFDDLSDTEQKEAVADLNKTPDAADTELDATYVLRFIDQYSETIKLFSAAEQRGVKKLISTLMEEEAATKKRRKKSS